MMGALKPSEQYEVVHKLVTTTSADEQLLVLEALLADCHADTRMPLLARLAANVPLEQRLKALLGDGHDGERAQLLLQVTASLPSGERTACWAEALAQLRPAEQQELLTRLLQGQPDYRLQTILAAALASVKPDAASMEMRMQLVLEAPPHLQVTGRRCHRHH